MKRKDDNEATLTSRLGAFHAQVRSLICVRPFAAARHPLGAVRPQTKPVVEYYSKQGLYAPINADQKSDV
eukprot:748380-Prymnesium_polylepis.1